MKISKSIFTFVLISLPLVSIAQEDEEFATEINDADDIITETFHSTRIINGHSTETLGKGFLEFRVEHKFGDIGGTDGGVQSLFGLDNSADIRIAFEYGLTDQMMIGLGRSKGTGAPYRSLIDGFYKYRFMSQKKGSMPLSAAVVGTATYSYMTASSDPSQVAYFPEWTHRLAYSVQLNIARKFHERFSMALIPTYVHRNYVAADDVNSLFALGAGARIGLSSKMAILLEYYYPIADQALRTTNTEALSIAFEWVTFGHNFSVYLTNAKGFGETQFIPYTHEDWLKGQFRLGFCIGRKYVAE